MILIVKLRCYREIMYIKVRHLSGLKDTLPLKCDQSYHPFEI